MYQVDLLWHIEDSGHMPYLLLNTKSQIRFVFLRDSWQIYWCSRQVAALLATKVTPILNLTLQEVRTCGAHRR